MGFRGGGGAADVGARDINLIYALFVIPSRGRATAERRSSSPREGEESKAGSSRRTRHLPTLGSSEPTIRITDALPLSIFPRERDNRGDERGDKLDKILALGDGAPMITVP
jgi:hypothetical protein